MIPAIDEILISAKRTKSITTANLVPRLFFGNEVAPQLDRAT
jgi:hypothetical protein